MGETIRSRMRRSTDVLISFTRDRILRVTPKTEVDLKFLNGLVVDDKNYEV